MNKDKPQFKKDGTRYSLRWEVPGFGLGDFRAKVEVGEPSKLIVTSYDDISYFEIPIEADLSSMMITVKNGIFTALVWEKLTVGTIYDVEIK